MNAIIQKALASDFLYQFRRDTVAMTSAAVLLVMVLLAVFAPWIATHDPMAQNLAARLRPPSGEHFFGTDELGRDIFSRVVYGARITLAIVLTVAVTVAPLGLIVGVVSGYIGGVVDRVLMRLTDVFLAFPRLILALALAAAIAPGLVSVIIAISVTGWAPYARLARAETLSIRKRDHILAVEVQGASRLRIMLGHIAPLCAPSMLVRVTLDMAAVILIAAGMGFLGVGAQPPTAEWGLMVATGREFLIDHWWVATLPGAAVFLTSLGFNLLGDGLRDILDPRHE